MAVQTFTRPAIAYSNQVNPTAVTAVGTSGISAFLGGFPASNLEYEDPWTMMKTASISGQPIISHQFSSARQVNVLGLINHNIGSAGYTTIAVESSPDGAAWTARASMTITSTGDSDVWVAWDGTTSVAYWRFKLGSGAAGNFYLGTVFWGLVRQADTSMSLANQARETPLVFEQASGGAKYTSFGADIRPGTMEVTWTRTTILEVDLWRQLPVNSLIGVLTPEHGDASTIILGQEVFWGYVRRRTMTPRGPGGQLTSQQARYDMTIELEGAV